MMKRNSFVLYLFLLMVTPALLVSCQQDDIVINELQEDDGRELAFAGPLASIDFSVYDMIEDLDENLWFGGDSLVYYLHREPVMVSWSHLVTLPEVYEFWTFSMPTELAAPFKAGTTEWDYSEEVMFSHQDDVRYDQLLMKRGQMILSPRLPMGLSGSVRIQIPEVSSNGEAFEIVLQSGDDEYIDLSGYQLDFTSNEVEPYRSRLTVNFKVEDFSGFPMSDQVTLGFQMRDMDYESAYGYFGYQEADEMDASLSFDFFDEIEFDEHIDIADFEMDVEVYNSIGVPFYVEATNIRFFHADDETPVLLEMNDESTIGFDYLPAATAGNPLIPGYGNFIVNGSNSNAVEIGNSSPARMLADIYASSNPEAPAGVEAPDQNFIFSERDLEVDLVLKVPFYFWADTYARMDTVEFDFMDIIDGSEDEVDHVEVAEVFFDFENELPIQIEVAAWVIDAEGQKVDDLLDANTEFVKGGDKGAPAATSFKVGLTAAQISLFKQREVKNIVLAYELSTSKGSTAVKIYGDSRFRAKVSAELNGSMPQ
ncbi:hypothetical protein [Geofilum rhodophaeum]|uniref:hypothetical protein n=1 Tax=Geofilum rhodophaeum TaxID=1965019 RepID=UPI0011BA8443|nr:hypothetical protein [Geofilum rhodophaeum]